MRLIKSIFFAALLTAYGTLFVLGSSPSSSSSTSSSYKLKTESGSDSRSSSRIVSDNFILNPPKEEDRYSNPQSTHVPPSNAMIKEELLQYRKMRKNERNREYEQRRLAVDPNFKRNSSRRFREKRKDDIEYIAKQKAYNKEYKKKNHQRILQTAKEYRAKNLAKIRIQDAIRRKRFRENYGLKPSTRKRKNRDAVNQPDQKRKKIESSQDEVNASKEHSQQARRNILRLKLSPETIKKHFPQSSEEKGDP